MTTIPMPAPGATTLYLVRHGRTYLNADGRLRGRLDPPLDDVGRAEAEAVARALRPAAPVLVVSSPLRRARETAEAIAAACRADVEIDDRLADRDYGAFAGHPREEVVAAFGSLDAAPGVEPEGSVLARVLPALDGLGRRIRSAPVAAVAHDAVNRAVLASLAPGRWLSPDDVPQRTGCVNVLRDAGHGWAVAEVDLLAGGPG